MRIVFNVLWLVLLFCLALSPYDVKMHLHSMGRHHQQFHLAAFIITSILLVGGGASFARRVLFSALSVAVAFATEILEQLRFHNPFEWTDVLSDCEGILIGVAVLTLISVLSRDAHQNVPTTRTNT